jgi:hypothetical protein
MFYHFYHSIYFRKTKSTEIQAAKNHRYATPLGVRSSSSRKEVRPLPHRKPKCCAFFKCPSVAAAGAKVPKKRKKRGRSREKTIPLNLPYLLGGLEHQFYFSHRIGNVIIPTDSYIFQRGWLKPPSSYSFE